MFNEAHGCLWNFNEKLPETSLKLGADIVVHSLHKTGGSMSQSSMLHISENSKINADDVERALMLLHTTGPLYNLPAQFLTQNIFEQKLIKCKQSTILKPVLDLKQMLQKYSSKLMGSLENVLSQF